MKTGLLRSEWIKHGFLNTLEHGFTRVADALSAVVLLWMLSPEIFSKLALAQAMTAPLLIVFLSPETVIYRDFAKWKSEGVSSLASRIRALRLFGWGKIQAAIILSILVAWGAPSWGESSSLSMRFYFLIWAFSLALAPQILGADREFLRLDLKLRELNFLSFFQKLTLLGGTVCAVSIFPGKIEALAGFSAVSVLSSAVLAKTFTDRVLKAQGASALALRGRHGPSVVSVLSDALKTFSIWQHLGGVVNNWIQTMDVFFMGLFQFPARQIGLYAVVLKLVNFSTALPMAMANLFGVWLGRRLPEAGNVRERRELWRMSLWLIAIVMAQAVVWALVAPFFIQVLSHGRWSELEQQQMAGWFYWILSGSTLLSGSFILWSWLLLRGSVYQLFLRVSLPWGVCALIVYGIAAATGDAIWPARANLIVGIAYVVFLGKILRPTGSGHVYPLGVSQ